MATTVLTYFTFAGRARAIRIALALGSVVSVRVAPGVPVELRTSFCPLPPSTIRRNEIDRVHTPSLTIACGPLQPYSDSRISFPEFGSLKAARAFPFGSMRVLDIGEERFAQSGAILRYVGMLAGLYPEDPAAALR